MVQVRIRVPSQFPPSVLVGNSNLGPPRGDFEPGQGEPAQTQGLGGTILAYGMSLVVGHASADGGCSSGQDLLF